MNVFFDTSSLFKLYHREADSGSVEAVFTRHTVSGVFVSELCKIEFVSALWKKARAEKITEPSAHAVLKAFEQDYPNFNFVEISSGIIEEAIRQLEKYGKLGLRSLDSIQLATAVMLKEKVGLFVSSDKLLRTFMEGELLPTLGEG